MCSAKNPFSAVTRQKSSTFNWDRTVQPVKHDSVTPYIETAKRLVAALDAYMQFLSDKLNTPIMTVATNVKSETSANRKLSDSTIVFYPERIQDYLRATIIIPKSSNSDVAALKKIINYLKNSNDTIGFKDQFSQPEPETGFRSFKVHTIIQDPEDSSLRMSAEIIVQHEGMLTTNKITEALRTMERQFRLGPELTISQVFGANSSTQARADITKAMLRDMRKHAHDTTAEKLGLNELITDPKVRAHHTCTVSSMLDRLKGGIPGVREHVAGLIRKL